MNIDLLANLIGELAVEHDEVALPEVGTFVAELSPAVFSDKGYTIVPPYRKLSFRQRMSADTLLVDLYSSRTGKSAGEAYEELRSFLIEMKEILKARKVIIFPGLGRLRATKENMFFFVQDADLDIYPDGFGLDQVSLKSHHSPEFIADAVHETAREIAQDAAGDAALSVSISAGETEQPSTVASHDTSEPVSGPASGAEPAAESEAAGNYGLNRPAAKGQPEEHTEVQSEEHTDGRLEKHTEVQSEKQADEWAKEQTKEQIKEHPVEQARSFPALLRVIIVLFVVLLLAAALLAVFGRVAPEFVDRFLYSVEDYKLLHG